MRRVIEMNGRALTGNERAQSMGKVCGVGSGYEACSLEKPIFFLVKMHRDSLLKSLAHALSFVLKSDE